MSALLNVKQFVRFDEHGNLHVPNKLFVACQAYVQTPLINDTSSRVATTEWVRAQISGLTGISLSETDPIWIFEKALYYTKVQADARYLQSFTETDPTVPAWAKTNVKPTYTFAELLSKPTTIAGYGITDIPTTLPASDVYAWAKAATKPSYAYSEITGLPTLFSGAYADLTGKPTLFSGAYTDLTGKPTIPTNNNQLTNGAGYLTSYTETDPIWTSEKANYALKTYVDTSVSNLVASAPAALNTLNELALALGSDANFSTTITTLIGTKEPTITAGTTLQYWRGDKTWQTLPTYNLSLYVPYTGATANVNLGLYGLTTRGLTISKAGSSVNGLIFEQAAGLGIDGAGFTTIGPSGSDGFGFYFGGTTQAFILKASSITSQRAYTMPNATGTLALTSDIVAYTLPTASATVLGGIKVGSNLSIDANGILSAGNSYALPTASATVLGGIKVGTNLSINATTGVLSSTDTTYAVFTGATASANGTSGLVTAPVIADRVKYLKGDGTWGTPTDTDTTYAAFTGSTTLVDGAAGLVPKPVVANRLQYLRGDGTWATPPDTDTDTNTVTSIRREDSDGTTGATTYRTGDIRLRQGANVTISEISAGIFQISSSYVDTDTNTWNANTKTVAGYVAAPGDVANKVWKTDATGNPAWRDDADTDTNTTYTAGTGLTLTGTSFSVTKTITAVETADTIALRNASGQLVATGFYQASSRELKTNINPFTKSALDIIREVAVVSFNYKTDVINKHIGFIAEDTPEELSTRNKNVMDSNNTIGLLLKAVQELEAKIKILESK